MSSAAKPFPSVDKRTEKLAAVHPRNLRAGEVTDPRESGIVEKVEAIDHKNEIGQCFDWALDRCRMTRQHAAIELGYEPDSNVVSRWANGTERPQLDKLREKLPKVYVAFLVTLLELEQQVEVRTLITLPRVG